MKKKVMNKKGISPLIATVLLIGFTVALVVLIILWGRSYTEEQAAKQGALAQAKLKCQDISFTVTAQPKAIGGLVSLKNLKSTQIDDFIFRVGSSDDKSAQAAVALEGTLVTQAGNPATLAGSATGNVLLTLTAGDSVEIIPQVLAGGKTYVPCSAQSKTAKVA